MCLGGQSRPKTPTPPPLPPATPPPAPAPEPAPAPTDLKDDKEKATLKSKASAREKAGLVNKGTSQLRIPLNTGSKATPNGGVNV